MRRARKWLLIVAALVFALGASTCYFGVRHDIAQIPVERRARMTDFDWIGVEWISAGLATQAFSVALVIAAWFVSRRKS